MRRVLLMIPALAMAFLLYRCGAFVGTPDIKQNPHPKMRYDITITIEGAPGPFDSVGGFMQYEVTNKMCVPLTGGPMNAMRIPPTANPVIEFKKVADNVYTGAVYADYFLDEDYFGDGVCHWSLMAIVGELKINKITFSPDISPDDVFYHKSVATYFVRGSYLANSVERLVVGSARPSDYPPELEKDVFSITLAAMESFQ